MRHAEWTGLAFRHPQLPLIKTLVACIGSRQYGQSRSFGRSCNQLVWLLLTDVSSGRLIIGEEDDEVRRCVERSDECVDWCALLELLLDVLDA